MLLESDAATGKAARLLAERTDYPVLPVAHNAGRFLAAQQLHQIPGHRRSRHRPVAIDSSGRSAADINRLAESWIESAVEEIRDIVKTCSGVTRRTSGHASETVEEHTQRV